MATGIRDKVAILGMGCSRFGERWDCGPEDLMLEAFNEAVADAGGPDTRSLAFLVSSDQEETVRDDVQRVRSWPYLVHLRVGGFIYDVDTGLLDQKY